MARGSSPRTETRRRQDLRTRTRLADALTHVDKLREEKGECATCARSEINGKRVLSPSAAAAGEKGKGGRRWGADTEKGRGRKSGKKDETATERQEYNVQFGCFQLSAAQTSGAKDVNTTGRRPFCPSRAELS